MIRTIFRMPERGMAFHLICRGAALYVVLRLATGMVLSLVGDLTVHAMFKVDPATLIFLMPLVGVVGLLDARRRNEQRFLANLGVFPSAIVFLVMLPCPLVEYLFQLLRVVFP